MEKENFSSTEKKSPNGIEGIHYMRNEYQPYGGLKITAENRKTYLNAFKQDYIQANVAKVEAGEMSNERLLGEAEAYARDHINFHKKMQKEHTKGNIFFRYKGRRERVITTEVISKMQKYLQDLEEKYVASEAAKEAGEELNTETVIDEVNKLETNNDE